MSDTFVRWSGHHVAERIRPVPGSPDAQRLAALADDPSSNWQREAVPEPAAEPAGRPPQAADKAAWVAYADQQDPGDHSGLTKAELISQYGGA
jgi:hypothetical protein